MGKHRKKKCGILLVFSKFVAFGQSPGSDLKRCQGPSSLEGPGPVFKTWGYRETCCLSELQAYNMFHGY